MKYIIFFPFKVFRLGMLYLLVFIIKIYQIFISPLFPSSCKYFPTCSDYAVCSLKKHGILLGLIYSIKRVIKCNPFSSGGVDLIK
jgi:hypothetical protein